MSERDHIHDPNDSEYELGDLSADMARNRPASGAAFAQSPQELDLDWKGGSAATDFLGIEGDTRNDEIPAAIGSALDTSGTGGLPADSWLHGIEDVAQAPADAIPRPAPAAKIEGEDRLEAIHQKATQAGTSSGFYKLVAALMLVLVGSAAGYWYWKKHNAALDHPLPVDVATKPTPPPAKPVAPNKPAPRDPTKPAPIVVNNGPTQSTDVAPIPPTNTTTGPIETEIEIPLPPPAPADTSTVAVAPSITFPEPGAVDPNATPNTTVEPAPTPSNFPVLPPSTAPIPGAVRRATEADFASVWLESGVPTEAIAADRRLRTVNVGPVRVMLENGEYFEGVLYAVGQNRVWLDLDLGRISFEAATVRDITRIAVPASSGKTKGLDLSGLPHVEVLLPGGWIAGRLVGQDGKSVTLVTDSGIRMVVETDDVRPITQRRTRVLGTVEKLGGLPTRVSGEAKKP